MAVGFSNTNKPINPRGNDASPKGYNRASLYSGKALDFDGVNDLVTISDNAAFDFGTSDFSIAFTMDSSVAGYGRILDKRSGTNGYTLSIGTSKELVLELNDGTGSSGFFTSSIYADGKLKHVVVSADRDGNASFYINGALDETIDISSKSGNLDSTSDLFIGADAPSGNSLYYNGSIAGVKIFNTALTAAQVADLYNNPEKVVPTGVANTALKLWLPMQEGAGTTAYDGSGNGNHGTISGATYTHGIGAPVSQTAVIDWNKSHNYIDKSEEFETASWSENALLTITNDSFIAPDGSATATEIVENTLNTNHFLAQTLSVTAGDYFISAYVKKRDYDWVQLSTGGDTSRYANFNISTGATGNASGISDLVIQDKGNGWYRIGGKLTTSSTSFNYFITLIQSDVASRFQTYTGTDKGQYIWGAQATKSATLQPYLRNIGTSAVTAEVLLPQGLTTGRDITGVNLFENVRKQGALNLDGNSWALVHDNLSNDIEDEVTLECWYYHVETTAINHLIGKRASSGGWLRIYSASSNTIKLERNGGSGSSNVYITENAWNHIVATIDDSDNMKIYINGTQQASAASFTPWSMDNSAPVSIAAWATSMTAIPAVNSRTTGSIAQPRIYNRALTAAEVLQNYNSGKNTYK